MSAPLPMTSKLLRNGLQLAEMRDHLGRVPTADEIREAFNCSHATAMRYQAAVRGTRIGGRLPAACNEDRPAPARHAAGGQVTDAEARLMAEFGFTREAAAQVLAHERGEGAQA